VWAVAGRFARAVSAKSRPRELSRQRTLAGQGRLGEETSEAYKDVAEVVRVCEGAGLATPVAKLRPFLVVKG
jgi:RNA-splicing ligase RtcB